MKNIISKFAALIVLVASVASCSKEEDFQYDGADNFISKLALTVDGVIYNAAIQDDEIIITVPTNVTLSGATVDYIISEKATISPDPAEKEDWNTEELFVVTSYNSTRQEYVYRVENSALTATGNIILNTQSEVDAFALNNYSDISGNLTIGKTLSAEDPITSLATLSSIKTIAYDLNIGVGYNGADLEGLTYLESVGAINIDGADSLKSIYLPALTTIGTTLNVTADNLESITIDQLTSIGENFTIKSNMIESSSFAKLAFIGGSMTFNGGSSTTANSSMERIQFPSLTVIDGDMYLGYWSDVYLFEMPLLELVSGTVTFKTWSSIETINLPVLSSAGALVFETVTSSLSASFAELTNLAGNLTLYSAGMISLSTPKLESVGGILYIYATCTKLTSLDFSSLSYIYQLNIRSTVLTDLNAFSALTEVEDILYLYSCTGFTGDLDLRGVKAGTLYLYGSSMVNMTSIIGDEDFDGKISIYTPTAAVTTLPTITGIKSLKSLYVSTSSNYKTSIDLNNLEVVKEDMTFQSCTYATEINCNSLTQAGYIKFLYCNDVQSINMPALKTITGYDETAGDFNYTVSSDLDKLDLSSLVSVDGSFTVSSIDSDAEMTKIDLGKIESIRGALTMSGSNAYFTDLSTFSTLTSVGSVSITTLTKLTSFEGLKGVISSLSASSWTVSGCAYNPSYQDMVDGKYSAE